MKILKIFTQMSKDARESTIRLIQSDHASVLGDPELSRALVDDTLGKTDTDGVCHASTHIIPKEKRISYNQRKI